MLVSKDPSLADLRFRHPHYFLSVIMFSDASQMAWEVVLVKDGLNQQIRDYWINLEGDINALEPRALCNTDLLFPFYQKRKNRCVDKRDFPRSL